MENTKYETKEYIKKVDIAMVVVIIGILLSGIFQYAYILSILACMFIKEDLK